MKRILIVLSIVLLTGPLKAQFSKSYQAIPVQDTIPQKIHGLMKARLAQDQERAAVETKNSKESTYMKSLYKGRFDYIVQNFNEDRFIVDSELNQYLTEILQNIQKRNSELPQDINVYVYRSSTPNAICFGEGTIVFSTSLLARLESEDQVAFVLCHEIAHQFKKHADRKVHDLTKLNFDKELNKQIKEIKSSSYGQYTKLKDLAKGLQMSITYHSRDHEFEADSVGLMLLLNTKYRSSAAVRTMEILDSIDRTLYPNPLDLKKFFNFKEYPFKASWSQYTKSDTWHKGKEDVDSLKTHPSCKKRALALQRQLKRVSQWPAQHVRTKDDVFNFIKTSGEFETLESEYHFKEYGKAMFRSMMMLERYPDNAYLHAMVAKCMYKLYENQKNHTIGKVLELPDPRYEENYDRYLTFLHRLRLSELENLAYYYVITKDEKYFSDENFLYSTWLISKLPMSKLGMDAVKDDYRALFPNGKYLKQMK